MTTSGPTLSIIPSAAVIDPHLTAPDIRVLALLGTHADRVGRCWPSIPTLAKPLGVSPRWVQRCLRKLERLKYVSTHPRPGSPAGALRQVEAKMWSWIRSCRAWRFLGNDKITVGNGQKSAAI